MLKREERLKYVKRKKLQWFKEKFGEMTSLEAFTLAIEAEEYIKELGPHDPAVSMFYQQGIAFMQYACLLELEEQKEI